MSPVRGRPTFQHGSLYTDTGTLLRGTYVSFDIFSGPTPTLSQIRTAKNAGLNAIHVYAESPGNELAGCGYSVGAKLNQVRDLNQMLRNEGMYMVLTIGNGCSTRVNSPGNPTHGESIFLQYALDFWNLYAAEFGDDTNVVFELYNEPYFYFDGSGILRAQPSSANTRDLMARTYAAVRNHAPNTPVLFFSYGTLRDAGAVNADISAVTQQIQSLGKTLTNWGIGFHPYFVPHATMAAELRSLLDQGRNLVMTELESVISDQTPGYCDVPGPTGVDHCVNRELVHLFETLEISWLHFVGIANLTFNRFQNQINYGINTSSIVWIPDFGNWPSIRAPPANGAVVNLKAITNGKWVSAARVGGTPGVTPLTADRTSASTNENFTIVRQGDKVCLRSQANEKIVDPGWGLPSAALIASKNSCTAEYALDWLVVPGNRVVLRGPKQVTSAAQRPSWRIISTDFNLTYPELMNDRLLVNAWEKFENPFPAP